MSPASRRLPAALTALALLAGCAKPASDTAAAAAGASGPERTQEVQRRVDALGPTGGRVELAPGTYELATDTLRDETCATCPPGQEGQAVAGTRALFVTGRDVHVVGSAAADVILRTDAGMGVVFDKCEGCSLENVTVTGGRRDRDANALDAAVVVRGGSVRISGCTLSDNIGNAVVVKGTNAGIGGVAATDGARVDIVGSTIARDSWHGVLALRGADVRVQACTIDGVERSSGDVIAGGRGAGVAAVGASVSVEGTRIARYWSGVELDASSSATVRRSVIEETANWGLLGTPAAAPAPGAAGRIEVAETAFYRTGACAVVIRGWPGQGVVIRDSVIALTLPTQGAAAPRQCTGVLEVPDGAQVTWVRGFANGGLPIDLPPEAFAGAAKPLVEALKAQPATAASTFLRDLGGMSATPTPTVIRPPEAPRPAKPNRPKSTRSG